MPAISKIKKRDGSIESFNSEKITNAVLKALNAVKEDKKKPNLAESISKEVVSLIQKHFTHIIPTVEDIQDLVEEVLLKRKKHDVARAYMMYRQEHEKMREFKQYLGVRDDLKLTPNAITVLAKRYLLKSEDGEIAETPSRLFRRVAKAIASVETLYNSSAKKAEETFYEMMSSLEFLPNTPTLMNAGTELGQLSACFVLPVEDDLKQIMRTCENMAIIHQSGGGTGFSFSKLRPFGDAVKSTQGTASGPVSFMRIFDVTTDVIKQGGKRRGANMGVLHVSHPDIHDFVNAKLQTGMLTNFNISVAVPDAFMEAVEKNKEWHLVNPRTKKIAKTVKAKEIFDLIVSNAWKTGDPGIIFIDEINRKNPTAALGKIESTNPCSEQPLHPYESCNLGSINLSKFVRNGNPNWTRLKECIHNAIHFLDNVIDANKYPLPEIEAMTKANRRIGLGIMGFADMLIMLGMQYNSNQAIAFAEKLMKFIQDEARSASNKLAEKRGTFPNFSKSAYSKKLKATRNATVTTIAPTGTISMIAGCSSGIEPLFAISYTREVLEHTKLLETNHLFEKIAKDKKFYSKSMMLKVAQTGSVQGIKEVPPAVKKLFLTSLEISPEWHIKIQAVMQKYSDSGVSKTINLPETAKVDDVRKAYLLAYKMKCKGITVYRNLSKKEQVLYISKQEPVKAGAEYTGGHVCEECQY